MARPSADSPWRCSRKPASWFSFFSRSRPGTVQRRRAGRRFSVSGAGQHRSVGQSPESPGATCRPGASLRRVHAVRELAMNLQRAPCRTFRSLRQSRHASAFLRVVALEANALSMAMSLGSLGVRRFSVWAPALEQTTSRLAIGPPRFCCRCSTGAERCGSTVCCPRRPVWPCPCRLRPVCLRAVLRARVPS